MIKSTPPPVPSRVGEAGSKPSAGPASSPSFNAWISAYKSPAPPPSVGALNH